MAKLLSVLIICALPMSYSMETDDTSALLQSSAKTRGPTPKDMIEEHEAARQSLYELPSPLVGSTTHRHSFVRQSANATQRAPSPFLRIFDPEFFLLHKQAHWGPFVSCQVGGGLDVDNATECEKAATLLGLGDKFVISEEGFDEQPSSRCQLRKGSVVWYGDDVFIGEQFCGENATACICASEVQPICEKPESFCTDGWAEQHSKYDCDGDGLADRMCVDTAFKKAGFLSSLNNCANTYPNFVGRCSAVTTGVWPQQQCAPFEYCEPQSGLATLAKGLVKIDLQVKELTGKKLGVGFYSPETTDPVSCVSLGKPTGSAPGMPEGCTFCAFQQDWQMTWGRGTRSPTHMLSMTCEQKYNLDFGIWKKKKVAGLMNKISSKHFAAYQACPAERHMLKGAAYVVCDDQHWCPDFVSQCCMVERNGCSDTLVPYFTPANATNATSAEPAETAAPAAPAEPAAADPAAADPAAADPAAADPAAADTAAADTTAADTAAADTTAADTTAADTTAADTTDPADPADAATTDTADPGRSLKEHSSI